MNAFKRVLLSAPAVATIRTAVGFVFLYASVGKILDPDGFAISISHYRLFPADAAMLLATTLPWVELLSGLGLVAGMLVRGSSLLTTALLIAFTAAVGTAMARGLDISCGCFTSDPAADLVGWRKVAENVLLILSSLIVHRAPDDGFSPVRFILRRLRPHSSPGNFPG